MGTLYIVATPIGNLKDLTFRALGVLKSVDYILCEDTRMTAKLLSHYSFKVPLVAFNDINERSKTGQVVNDLTRGRRVALVSDSGTPLVSDPGFYLVREAIRAQIKIESVPGPTALIAALTVSGLPIDKFTFLGYLPKKPGKKEKLFSDLKASKSDFTAVFFESPHRIVETLSLLKDVFGNKAVLVICRELTKIHQEILRGTPSSILAHFEKISPRGEFVVVFRF